MSESGIINLPPQLTPFIGRRDELAEITRLLADPSCRLLTLTGPGGIGKSRLALEAARIIVGDVGTRRAVSEQLFPNGVHFIPLQPLTSPDFIVPAIADAIGFQFYQGSDPKQQLLDFLLEKSMLLIMDNFEHLLEGTGILSELLSYAPGTKALVTSRERLNLREEWVLEVRGLSVPASETEPEIEDYSAVQLFVQNARRAQVGFSLTDEHTPAVTRICRLVDGMPLGIELAAAWVRVMPCAEIAREVEHSLDILETPARNVPLRHRTMRAVFEPTWVRLADDERNVFMKLSVFRGGFTREAAEYAAGATLRTLSALVDKSLLRVDAAGYYNLHELLHQYAGERLDQSSEEVQRARDRHCSYYTRFMEQQWPRLSGREIKAALTDISAEMDNVRAAWDWAVTQRKAAEVEAALRSLWFFYGVGVRFQEGAQVFISAAAAFRGNTAVYAKLLARGGELTNLAGSSSDAKGLLEESLSLLRQVNALDDVAFVLFRLASIYFGSDFPKTSEFLEESLDIYTELGRPYETGEVLVHWGLFHAHQYVGLGLDEALPRAQQCFEEGLAVFQQHNSSFGIAVAHLGLTIPAYFMGDYHRCLQYAQTSLEFFQELGIGWGITWSLLNMANAACGLGDYTEARRRALEGLMFGFKAGWPNPGGWIVEGVQLFAVILMGEGQKERAYELLGVAAQQRQRFENLTNSLSRFILRLLDEEMPPHLAAAVERGRKRDLDAVVQEIFADLSSVKSATALPSLHPRPLTERELEILHLVAQGLSNREIARELVVSLGTVKTHIHNICSKLNATSRTQAIARARDLNLI